jgi:hypothetical protein
VGRLRALGGVRRVGIAPALLPGMTTNSISLLPAPATAPKALPSGRVVLFKDDRWNSDSLTLDINDYASGQRQSLKGSKLQDAATWIAFNLPEGTVMTLSNNLMTDPPKGNVADLKGLGQVVDLVGTGRTEAVDLKQLKMNDQISMFFWRKVDLSVGAIELYQDVDFKGNRTVIFLSEWPRDAVVSMDGWFIADNRLSSAKWSTLPETQTAKLFEKGDASGQTYANIKGWGSFKQLASFKTVSFNDTASAFSWSALAPMKEIIDPVQIDLDPYAQGGQSLSNHINGTNNSNASTQANIQINQSDAETVTVTVTDTVTTGAQVTFTYSIATKTPAVPEVSPEVTTTFTLALQLSLSYTHTTTTTTTSTKTQALQVSQNFTVPPNSAYQAWLTVQMGQIPAKTYTTTAQRWYVDQLPGSVFDPATGWYQRTETMRFNLSAGVACSETFRVESQPLSQRT